MAGTIGVAKRRDRDRRWRPQLGHQQQLDAGATKASVRLRPEGDGLVFEVADDGRGFDSEHVPMGSGLQNMADRLAALGGALEVRSRPGQGTTVTGRLPVETVSSSGLR